MLTAASIPANLLSQSVQSDAEKAISGARTMMSLHKAPPISEEKAEAAAQDFESMFLAQMLSQMFGESLGVSMFGDKQSREIYKGMMVDEYGKKIAAVGGIGIASYVKRELLAMQEVEK